MRLAKVPASGSMWRTRKREPRLPAAAPQLRVMPIAQLAQEPRVSRAFPIADWMPDREVTLLAGHGGVGKTFIALIAGVMVALGKQFFGIPCQRRRVLFLSMEDRSDIVLARLEDICRDQGVDLADLEEKFVVVDGTGIDGALYSGQRDAITCCYEQLRECVRAGDVIIIDSAADAFDGDEIRRRQVRGFLRKLRRLVEGGGAVLLLAHVDKMTARSTHGAEGYSGSTAWHNTVRARWYLRFDVDRKKVCMSLEKSNYGAHGDTIELYWDKSARVFRGKRIEPIPAADRDKLLRDAAMWIVKQVDVFQKRGEELSCATTGPKNVARTLLNRVTPPESFSARDGKKFLYSAIELALDRGWIKRKEVKYGKSNTKKVYVVADAPPEFLSLRVGRTQEAGTDSGAPDPEFLGGVGDEGTQGNAPPSGVLPAMPELAHSVGKGSEAGGLAMASFAVRYAHS